MQLFSCQLHVSQRKASTPEVSENFLCLLELDMFPMCTSNDPARFALKGNFPHHLEYSNHLHACVLIPAWVFRLYYVEDWPRFVKFLCARGTCRHKYRSILLFRNNPRAQAGVANF
jgi:hypothetical protein